MIMILFAFATVPQQFTVIAGLFRTHLLMFGLVFGFL